MADQRAAGLHDERAVVADEDDGLDPERSRRAARRLQRPPRDDDEQGAGGDELGDGLGGAGDGRGLVVEQGPVQVAGEQQGLAGTPDGRAIPRVRPARRRTAGGR